MTSRSENIRAEHRASSLWITINRPEKSNCVTADMLQAISEAMARAFESASIQVIVLRGRGDTFSAGLDLKRLFASRESARELFEALADTSLAIRRARQPVVASVDGSCVAGGLQLAACCDLVIASDRATFRAPGAQLGFLHSTPAVPLTRSLTRAHAMEFLLLGRDVTAERAREMGLVNWVVPAAKLEEETEALARRLAGGLSLLRGDGKAGLHEQLALSEEKAYASLTEKMLTAWDTGIPKRKAEETLDEKF